MHRQTQGHILFFGGGGGVTWFVSPAGRRRAETAIFIYSPNEELTTIQYSRHKTHTATSLPGARRIVRTRTWATVCLEGSLRAEIVVLFLLERFISSGQKRDTLLVALWFVNTVTSGCNMQKKRLQRNPIAPQPSAAGGLKTSTTMK